MQSFNLALRCYFYYYLSYPACFSLFSSAKKLGHYLKEEVATIVAIEVEYFVGAVVIAVIIKVEAAKTRQKDQIWTECLNSKEPSYLQIYQPKRLH